jgi:EAL domain-containing protein (putative c-di-GMP-specific phosphodiesterase class I)
MSSFSYLKTLPVDYVKIDGSFISDIVIDPLGRSIVNGINQIAHTMKLQTIAEFVESQSVVEELQRLKIDYAQGFHICMPFPISELSNYKKLATAHPWKTGLHTLNEHTVTGQP